MIHKKFNSGIFKSTIVAGIIIGILGYGLLGLGHKEAQAATRIVSEQIITGQMVTGTITSPVVTVSNAPMALVIPKASVNAHIILVGVTPTDNLDVPPNFVEVGWYKYGPVPGQIGNAVLDGHVDNGASIKGVFKYLHTLKSGDDIYVTSATGQELHFIVTATNIYSTTHFPSNEIFNDTDGTATLKIITCYGTFTPSTDTYDRRFVVTAVLAS